MDNHPLAQVEHRLGHYGRFGVELGLERIQRLLAALGNPQQRVPIIHVAGTNGKGSVCAYLGSILGAAGYRVGVYTSPHLVSWCDRISLNQQPISPADLLNTLDDVEAAIDPTEATPTQFEVVTAVMWLYFARASVGIAVIEVGLGGRLDATNACDRPLVTVITSLSLEHWQRLGPTLAHIAGEKAGILKPNCPAVIGPLPEEARQVVAQRLLAVGCPSLWPEPAIDLGDRAQYRGGKRLSVSGTPLDAPDALVGLTYPLPLLGSHQRVNSALAIAALTLLRSQGWDIPVEAILEGLAQTRWPGRLEWVRWQGHLLLIDGAHNPAAAEALRGYVDGLVRSEEQGVRSQQSGSPSPPA
ncbi:bifunctional folylpolyglutamate synthase/dihydrofolate synthase, partial [filamentous cyanobacterium CCP5]